jgi:tetratricopeptide (TPR) repeat protein
MERALRLASMLLLGSLAIAVQNANCVSGETGNFLQLNETDASAWYNLGEELLKNGKNNESLDAYSNAIEMNESYAEAWNHKGKALFNLKRFNESRSWIDYRLVFRPAAELSLIECWFAQDALARSVTKRSHSEIEF